jgi:hypothetical protein
MVSLVTLLVLLLVRGGVEWKLMDWMGDGNIEAMDGFLEGISL